MGNIMNAFPHAVVKEKVYTISRPEFGIHKGRIVLIKKALYGLKTSRNMWHAHFSDKLQKIGWKPLQMYPNLWIFKHRMDYKYLVTHTNNFIISSTECTKAMKQIEKSYIIKNIRKSTL